MSRFQSIGIGIGHLVVSTAQATGQSASRVPSFVTDVLPGASVMCRPGAGLLPVSFHSARAVRDGQLDWLGTILTRLREHWLPSLPPGELRTALAVPSSTSVPDRARCREVARRAGWENVRVVGNDVSVARAAFGDISDPVTTLIVEMDFEELLLSVATVLGGVARVRSRLRLSLLTHRLVDEVILSMCLTSTGARTPADLSSWGGMWLDACKVRRELGVSEATAIELNASGWGGTHLVSVSRDDLWPVLRRDVEVAVQAARELVERSLAPRERLGTVLLVGGGILEWAGLHEYFRRELQAPIESLPVQGPAIGAALLASEPDDPLTDSIDPSDPNWSRTWEERIPSIYSQRTLPRLRVESDGTSAPSSTSNDREYQRTIQGMWSYLRGVASVDPTRAKRMLEELRDQTRTLLESLDVPEEAINPHLDRATRALLAGRLGEAISASHDAFHELPDDPAVFRRMIEIHVEAAKAQANHETAVNWLECAHGHDQANASIHRHLARRHREHARSLSEAGQAAQALTAVRRSLTFEPLDAEARALEGRLEKQLGESGERW